MESVHPRRQDSCPDCGRKKERKAKRCRPCYEKHHRVGQNFCACGKAITSKAKQCWTCRIESSRAHAKRIEPAGDRLSKLRYHDLQLLETENLELLESTLDHISVKCRTCSNLYVFDRYENETWACVHCDRVKLESAGFVLMRSDRVVL